MHPTEKVTTEEATEVVHEEEEKKTVKVSKVKPSKLRSSFQFLSLYCNSSQHFCAFIHGAMLPHHTVLLKIMWKHPQVLKRRNEWTIDWLWFPAVS